MSDVPVAEPLLTNLLVRKLINDGKDVPPLEHAFDTLVRHSDAGGCARKIGLKALGYEQSEPPDAAGIWVMYLGSRIHEALQSAISEEYGEMAEIEAKVRWDDLSASGHLDALIDLPGKRICYELKTKGGFGFDKAVGLDRKGYKMREKGPEGPGALAVLQGSLNALASHSDELRIGVIALESVSKGLAEKLQWDDERRFLAEWRYTRDQFEPWAKAERGRLREILRLVDKNVVPDRWAVGDDMTQLKLNPDLAKPAWQCLYCAMRSQCSTIGPGEVAL